MHPVLGCSPVSVCMLTHLHMHEHQQQYAALTCTRIHPAEMTQNVNLFYNIFGGVSLLFIQHRASPLRPATCLQQRQRTAQDKKLGQVLQPYYTGCNDDNDDKVAAATCD